MKSLNIDGQEYTVEDIVDTILLMKKFISGFEFESEEEKAEFRAAVTIKFADLLTQMEATPEEVADLLCRHGVTESE